MAQVDKATARRYEDLFELVNSPGWGHILEDIENDLANADNILKTSPHEVEIFRMQGYIQPLRHFKNLKQILEAQWEHINSQPEEEDDADV